MSQATRARRRAHQGFPSGSQPMPASQAPACGVPACGPVPARQAGFATVLILMLLFMMLLLTITYLRTMRAYSLTHPRLSNADAAPVLAQLETDIAAIIGADGKIAPSLNAPSTESPLASTDIHEPYDYPWTNSSRFLNSCRLTYPKYQASSTGMGDPMTDDAWLSPWGPETSGNWVQVSNIAGSFLVYANANLTGIPQHPVTHEYVPMDAPAGKPIPDGLPASQQLASGQFVTYQNLSSTDPRLVDTDGDGNGDALWFYPKKSLSNGVRYVAAARIVDLSGCLNLNTALGELGAAPGTQSGTPLKGEGPYEINAKRLDASLSLLSGPGTTSKTYRSASATTDWDFWRLAGGQAGADGQTSASATGGRYGGTGTSAAPKLGDEAQLRDLSNKLANGTSLSPAPKLFNAPSNGNAGHYGALPSNTLRSQLTTISGAAERVAYPTFLSWNFGPNRAADLNLYQMDATTGNKQGLGFYNPSGMDGQTFFWSGPTPLMQTFFGGPDNNTAADDYPFPEGFKQLIAGAGGTSSNFPVQYQIQTGFCLQDALERDNRPTVGWSWMGWKPLPIMTEFYAQMPYVVQAPYQIPWNTTTTLNATATTSAGWTPNAAVLVFPNTTIAQLNTNGLAYLRNLNVVNYNTVAQVFFYSYTAGSNITAQFQAVRADWGPRTECFKVQFTDSAAGVVAQLLYGKGKLTTSAPLGTDFDPISGDAPYQSDFRIGLPIKTGSTWTQAYVNAVQNRTATDASVATMSTAGQQTTFNEGGGSTSTVTNPTTDTIWQATGIAGVGSYAFELTNPYSIPIRLNNLRFKFRKQDRGDWSALGNNIQAPPSQDLSTYITAATGLAKDAEGNYVLKPQEKIVFYRNGTEYAGPGGARRRPMGGPAYASSAPTPGTPASTDISGLIATGTGVYKVNLSANATPNALDTTAPDINAYPGGSWNVATIELEVNAKDSAGANYGWVPYNHMVFQGLPSGDAYNDPETNVPDGYQAAPGDLVYHQQDVRTFGSEEKLNLLQARPACFPFSDLSSTVMPVDMGDTELRTNFYSAVGSGVLPHGTALIYPSRIQSVSMSGGNYWGHVNTTGSTMPLGHPTATMNYLSYDGTSGTANISALGQSSKVAFRSGATITGGPNGNNAMYGGNGTSGGQRQDIRDGSLFFNYMGLQGSDATTYPGTFPELAASPDTAPVATPDGGRLGRDNTTAKERHDGTPHAMDIGKILLAGPIWWDFSTGNHTYRGIPSTTNGGWGGGNGVGPPAYPPAPTTPTVDQLTNWYQYTIGDAINFHLAKDIKVAIANGTSPTGLKGLCLRTDKPFYDASKVGDQSILNSPGPGTHTVAIQNQTLDQLYTALNTATLANQTADIATLRAGIRGLMHGNLSWADAAETLFNVDNMKYKGKFPGNSDDFRAGTININTAPQAVLNCLSLPTSVPTSGTPAMPSDFTAGIIAARQAPKTATGAAAPRQGLARVSELQNQGIATFNLSGATAANTLYDAVSWLPQQASCRSDVYCAYILVQGYKQDNFNLGPVDVRRAVVIYSRGLTGSPATKLAEYVIPNR